MTSQYTDIHDIQHDNFTLVHIVHMIYSMTQYIVQGNALSLLIDLIANWHSSTEEEIEQTQGHQKIATCSKKNMCAFDF